MKFSALFPRKEKAKVEKKDIDQVLFEAGKELIKLKERYSITLQRELAIARRNKEKGIKNSANYSKIGIAYYSLNIVQSAQEKVRDLTSSRELYNCMNQMTSVLGMINGITGKIGKLNPADLIKGIGTMNSDSSGAGKDLLKTLAALSGASLESKDNVSIDSLVSVDVIERLIAGADPENCVKASEGIVTNTGEVMDVISKVLETEPVKTEETATELTMEDINELLSKL